jgi:hypothetical protein
MPRVGAETISGLELRARIKALGLTNAEAAIRLGITEDGLYKAMAGTRRVGRQTEIILGFLEILDNAAEEKLPGRCRRA